MTKYFPNTRCDMMTNCFYCQNQGLLYTSSSVIFSRKSKKNISFLCAKSAHSVVSVISCSGTGVAIGIKHGFSCILGVVGWCEGAVYLTSLGRPTDIGLQLGKACYPCSG